MYVSLINSVVHVRTPLHVFLACTRDKYKEAEERICLS